MKILSLACGIALTAYVGLVPAAEVSSGTELPAILGAVADYQPLNAPEMEKIQGEEFIFFGKVVWDWGWKRRTKICFPICPKTIYTPEQQQQNVPRVPLTVPSYSY